MDVRRYKCKCCKYKREVRLFATTCVNHDFKAVDVQILCTYLKVPIERPGEWTLLDSKQAYVRPSVLWALEKLGIMENFSKRPNKLEEILKKVLQREDLATEHQELLDKYPTVKMCLLQFQSCVSSPVSDTELNPINHPIQETAAVQTSSTTEQDEQGIQKTEMEYTSDDTPTLSSDQCLPPIPDQNQLQPIHSMSQGVTNRIRRDSEWSSYSRRTSSGFFERTISNVTSRTTSGASTMSYDSGVSVASLPPRKKTNDSSVSSTACSLSLLLETSSLESILDSFCTNCRTWIDNISPHGTPLSLSPPPAFADSSKINIDATQSSSAEDSQSLSSTSTNLESSIPTTSDVYIMISSKMVVKKKELVKNLKASKRSWSCKSALFPDTKELHNHPEQYRMRLYIQDVSGASNQSCATLSLDLLPVPRDMVHIQSMTVFVSVDSTNDKAATTGSNIASAKKNVELRTINRKTTEISQFPELITLDLLKRIKEKYIVTEVSVRSSL